jgi:hypothetical protein
MGLASTHGVLHEDPSIALAPLYRFVEPIAEANRSGEPVVEQRHDAVAHIVRAILTVTSITVVPTEVIAKRRSRCDIFGHQLLDRAEDDAVVVRQRAEISAVVQSRRYRAVTRQASTTNVVTNRVTIHPDELILPLRSGQRGHGGVGSESMDKTLVMPPKASEVHRALTGASATPVNVRDRRRHRTLVPVDGLRHLGRA